MQSDNNHRGELLPPIIQRGEDTMTLLDILMYELGYTREEAKDILRQINEE